MNISEVNGNELWLDDVSCIKIEASWLGGSCVELEVNLSIKGELIDSFSNVESAYKHYLMVLE